MRFGTDEMLTRWLALSETHRAFLRRARDVERTLPCDCGPPAPGDPILRVLPLMDWREIGASCGMSESTCDDGAAALHGEHLILIWDRVPYAFGLTGGRSLVNEVDSAERARWWRRVEMMVVAAGAAL